MTRKSSEEIKKERIDVMGDDLGNLYDALYNELIWTKSKWIEYVELFGTNEKRIDVMNRSAPRLFYIMQEVLFRNILLELSKMSDKPGNGKDESITFRALPNHISDQIFKKKVQSGISQIKKKTTFSRDWRNRVIAHKDLNLALKSNTTKALEVANRKKVNEALESFEDVINLFESNFFNSQIPFGLLKSEKGAISLLYLINDGFKYREERDKTLKDIEESLI